MDNISYLDHTQKEILEILDKKSHLANECDFHKLKQLLLLKLVHLENMTIKQKGTKIGEQSLDLFTQNIDYTIFNKGDFIYQYNQYCKDVYIILYGEVGIWEKKKDTEITRQLECQKKISKLEAQLQEAHLTVEQDYYIEKIEEATLRLEKYRQKSKEKLLQTALAPKKYFITTNICGYRSNFSMKSGSFIGDNQAVSGEKFEKSYQIFSEKCVCLKISGFKFNEIFDLQVKKINYIENILQTNFPHANPQSLLWLAYQSHDRYLNYDEKVFMEDEKGDSIFIIKQGSIEQTKLLTIKNSTYNKQNIRKNVVYEKRLELATLQDGNMFGIEDMKLSENDNQNNKRKKAKIEDGFRYYRARATYNPISLVYEIHRDKINKIILENCDIPLQEDILRMSKMKQKWMKERFQHLVDFNTEQMSQIFQRRKVIQAQMAYKKKKLVDTVLSQLSDTHTQQEQEHNNSSINNNNQESKTQQNSSFESKKGQKSSKFKSLQSMNTSFDQESHQQKRDNVNFKRRDKQFKTCTLLRVKSQTSDGELTSPLIGISKMSQRNITSIQENMSQRKQGKSETLITLDTNLVQNYENLDQDNKVYVAQQGPKDTDLEKIKLTEKIKRKMHIYRQKISNSPNKNDSKSQALIRNQTQIGFPSIMEDSADSQCTPMNLQRNNSANSANLDSSRIIPNTPSKFAAASLSNNNKDKDQINESQNSQIYNDSLSSSNNSSFQKPQSQSKQERPNKKYLTQYNFSTFSGKVNPNIQTIETEDGIINTEEQQQLQSQQQQMKKKPFIPEFYKCQEQITKTDNSINGYYPQGCSFDKLKLPRNLSVNQSGNDYNSEYSDDEKQFQTRQHQLSQDTSSEKTSLFYNQTRSNTTNPAQKKNQKPVQNMTQQQQFQSIVSAREQVNDKYFAHSINSNKSSDFWIPNSKQKEIQKKYAHFANFQKQQECKKSKHFQPANFKGNTEKLLDRYISQEQVQNPRNNCLKPYQSLKTLSPLLPPSRSNLREESKLQNSIFSKKKQSQESDPNIQVMTYRNCYSYRAQSTQQEKTTPEEPNEQQQQQENLMCYETPKKPIQMGTLSSIKKKHMMHQKLFTNNQKKQQNLIEFYKTQKNSGFFTTETSRKNSMSDNSDCPQQQQQQLTQQTQQNFYSSHITAGSTCYTSRDIGTSGSVIMGQSKKLEKLPRSLDKRYMNSSTFNNNNQSIQNPVQKSKYCIYSTSKKSQI